MNSTITWKNSEGATTCNYLQPSRANNKWRWQCQCGRISFSYFEIVKKEKEIMHFFSISIHSFILWSFNWTKKKNRGYNYGGNSAFAHPLIQDNRYAFLKLCYVLTNHDYFIHLIKSLWKWNFNEKLPVLFILTKNLFFTLKSQSW